MTYVHFAHSVILFAHNVTYSQQRVTLEQNFVSPTYVVKIEIQDEIWTVQFFWPNLGHELPQPFLPLFRS